MASTNEDAVVLATSPADDGRLLVIRHLPDRGTVEIGWWERTDDGSVLAEPTVIELAAEAVEIAAVARLCEELAGAKSDTAADGGTIAETPPGAEGARVLAVRAGDGVTLVRQPEGGSVLLPSHSALDRLAAIFPAALRKLNAQGFGLMQQDDPTASSTAQDQADSKSG